MLSLPMGVIRQFVDIPPPPAGVPGPFSLADAGALEQAVRVAGLADVSSEALTVTMERRSAQEFVEAMRDLAPPVTVMLSKRPSEKQAEVWQAITDAVGRYAGDDGAVRIPNEAICVSGRR